MDKSIAQFNIERFRKRLAENPDEATRQTLLRLLAEEELMLAALQNAPKAKKAVG
jgi:hypothetical protein